ncbi:hypothetical protein LOC67_11115 [Stieleria sp. JC731]|uniref:hypothetical protein n=1 Tax=Pirellulaceae TaxID=2691357 RepID=UPI001E479D6C|nr:hypothetical protein [Stieleria sp. JC731]MCC9601097.1 hypothetical protein [Stieleria sp. JC731]
MRSAKPYELAVIGLSIWIVYTVDRLLDSRSVPSSGHSTDRHRFHYRYRYILLAAWFTAVTIVACLTVRFATEAQLRWGIIAIALSIAYVISAQLLNQIKTMVPKEIRAGALFAAGTTLVAWADISASAMPSLFITTVLAAMLFSINCFSVSALEVDVDDRQGLDSLAHRHPTNSRLVQGALIAHFVLTIGCWVFAVVPNLIFICLAASNVLLQVHARGFLVSRQRESKDNRLASTSPAASLADLALIVTPLFSQFVFDGFAK